MADIKALSEALEKKRAELEKLEADVAAARKKQFIVLPEQVGLKTVDELIEALLEHASPRLRRKFAGVASSGGGRKKAPKAQSAGPAGTAPGGRRTRTRITDELRKKVIDALKAGEKTSAEVAQEFGISVPSVANIKKAAGLVNSRAG